MVEGAKVELTTIRSADLPAVGRFLHAELDATLSAEQWARVLRPTWRTEADEHGFMLELAGQIVGVYAAFYSEQRHAGVVRKVCNLAAWCVREEHRHQSLRLVRAMVKDRERDLVDLSPSGNVVATNERLGFEHLDTSGALVFNVPWRTAAGARVVHDPDAVADLLSGDERAAFDDHRGSAAARHLALVRGDRVCWVVYRTVRRKRLPWFASVLHVSDPDLFAEAAGPVWRHLAWRARLPFTLVERRVVGDAAVPWHAVKLAHQRPKMFRSRSGPEASTVSQLYSELTQVPW